MSNESFLRIDTRRLLIALGAASALSLASGAQAGNAFRVYNFEEGSAGATTTSVADSVTDTLVVGSGGAAGFYWMEVPGGTARPLPGGNLQASVDANALSAPALTATNGFGTATFVNVAGSSPVSGSTLALGFSGATSLNDLESGGGSRGVYAEMAAYDGGTANVITAGADQNVFESFSLFTQAWINPNSSAQGTRQTVFQAGQDQGSVSISANGFWEIGNIGGGFVEGETTEAVVFDDWTHVAIMRGGNGAELFINGVLVTGDVDPTPANFFNTFSSQVTLGSASDGSNEFTGLVDDFSLTGFADVNYDRIADNAFFDDFLQGDLNVDGAVNGQDLAIMAANFGSTGVDLADGDITGDGTVNGQDLAILAANFGASAVPQSSAVPEPGSLALLGLGGLALLRRRR